MSQKNEIKLTPLQRSDDLKWAIYFKGLDAESIRRGFLHKLEYNLSKDKYTYVDHDGYLSLAYAVRDRLIERWIITQQKYHRENVKRIYYLSLEFLMGRLLDSNITNLGMYESTQQAIDGLKLSYEDIEDQEVDAGLGNGGLGRLAACFLDSMATMELPAIGYGIRYEFGIFTQKIVQGYQKEQPEQWLETVNPWEIERAEYTCRVQFYGSVDYQEDSEGNEIATWRDTENVLAVPFDTPIPGFDTATVNTLRLWSARSANEIDLEHFQAGDYIRACQDKLSSENISKVLYPNDSNHSGRELRLKQQYFFTSASLQDIIRRFLAENDNFLEFPNKVSIQLNDTHPSIAIAELMRLLIDVYKLPWNKAWNVVVKTFAYTNHTLMPEALEKWPVNLMKNLLPRHMDIIYKINSKFLRLVSYKYPQDTDRRRRMSLIEEGDSPQIRMAYLAIVGSHSVNGVAKLHTELLSHGLVRDFYELWPEKFNSKTNGITQRRWLYKSNRPLSHLISSRIGTAWVKDLFELKKLTQFSSDPSFQKEWQAVKYACKRRLADKLRKYENLSINPDMLFDIQIKRIHEYKRQLLNVLHCIHLYNELKSGKRNNFIPRTVFFGGKAAPGYYMAKLIIKFINSVEQVINHDPDTCEYLQVYFIPNYRVTLAEYLIPAADLSEQISTAGTEASGTGNMKFALNGALTIGTRDGATIEMCEEIGEQNMFLFGLTAREVDEVRASGYVPYEYYKKSDALRKVIDLINTDYFSPENPHLFKPLIDSLFNSDRYLIFADFESYCECHRRASDCYRDQVKWTEMSIQNVASIGKFSSDRTIRQYAEEIWDVKPVHIELDR
ncbi:MAG: glycogen/starch/alpha-glucan phosphorylase [Chitinivibrionales bacterium]|nr:glycogen/starch/alpha-glucan phosphorylase [Chitinivibrionales bacterium]